MTSKGLLRKIFQIETLNDPPPEEKAAVPIFGQWQENGQNRAKNEFPLELLLLPGDKPAFRNTLIVQAVCAVRIGGPDDSQ